MLVPVLPPLGLLPNGLFRLLDELAAVAPSTTWMVTTEGLTCWKMDSNVLCSAKRPLDVLTVLAPGAALCIKV